MMNDNQQTLMCSCGHRWEPGLEGLPQCPACGRFMPPQLVATLVTTPPEEGASPGPENGPVGASSGEAGGSAVCVPGYEVVAELGRGGMGVVYRARQLKAKRDVALKMVLAGEHASEGELTRFATEARTVAQLQHPNIVQVYEVGEHEGRAYFSLELCEGGSLDRKLNGVPMPPRDAACLIQTLALAVQAAHERRIIHRDLKPANVLFAHDGVPKIADFGLAKVERTPDSSQSADPHTATGTVLGTPSYMAPEQARGKCNQLTPATDVYALGAILYECLTGRPPFRETTTFETIRAVLDCDPVPPRLRHVQVDRDLDAITLKCLEKEPAHRYDSARALAEDLDRYLNGELIQATSLSVLDRLTRALERSKAVVEFDSWSTLLLTFAGLILIGHSLSFVFIQLSQPGWLIALARTSPFLFLVLAFWQFRSRILWPTSAAEKQLWGIWIGYFLSYGASRVTFQILFWEGLLTAGPREVPGGVELMVYPVSTILAGFGFFVMGSSYWGRCYALGVLFWVVGILMPLKLDWAPLTFGGVWAFVLTVVALHLRRLQGNRPEPTC